MVRFSIVALAPLLLSATVGAFAPNAARAGEKVAHFNTAKTNLPFIASPVSPRTETTQLNDMLAQTELPEKLYFKQEKEVPKVLGGVKIGLRKLVVVTGASSGLGLKCAATLAKTGKYFVVMACRDIKKAKKGKAG